MSEIEVIDSEGGMEREKRRGTWTYKRTFLAKFDLDYFGIYFNILGHVFPRVFNVHGHYFPRAFNVLGHCFPRVKLVHKSINETGFTRTMVPHHNNYSKGRKRKEGRERR